MMKAEHRTILSDMRITRADEPAEGSIGTIEGYAALFDTRSELLAGFFFEEIEAGAFDDVLEDDVRALIDHESGRVIGRSSADTLRTKVDEKGLFYEVDLPDTADARDLKVLMNRGDVRESSFGFTVAPGGDQWVIDEEGRTIRTITKISRLWDVSPVAFPAYADTTVAVRCMHRWQAEELGIDDDGQPARRSQDPPADIPDAAVEELRAEFKAEIEKAQALVESLRGKVGAVQDVQERMTKKVGAFMNKYRPIIDRLTANP